MLSLQTSTYSHVRHVCLRCLNTFNCEKSLESHHECCKSYEAIQNELPEEGSNISVKNYNRSMRVPFIVYADFESSHHSYQHAIQIPRRAIPISIRHISGEFCYYIKCFDDTLYSQEIVTFIKEFNDDDVAQIVIDTLENNIKEI